MPYERPGIFEGLPNEPAIALAALSVVMVFMARLSSG
jgi:hypothetical protein